jgi:hypothetical protein
LNQSALVAAPCLVTAAAGVFAPGRLGEIEHISRLVGHSSTTTTETIYRKQIRPVIVHGADVMDRIFPGEADHSA